MSYEVSPSKTPIAYDHPLSLCIVDSYPSVGYPCNPVALGTRWLAFSETKVHLYNNIITWIHFNKHQVTKFDVFYVFYSCRLSTRVWGVCQMPRPPPWPPPCSRTSRRASQLSVSAHYTLHVQCRGRCKHQGEGEGLLRPIQFV